MNCSSGKPSYSRLPVETAVAETRYYPGLGTTTAAAVYILADQEPAAAKKQSNQKPAAVAEPPLPLFRS